MNQQKNTLSYFQKIEEIEPRIYYHYTSLEALFNIVNSKTFRLTSLLSSNDRKELYYHSDRFIEDFNYICENESDSNTKKCFQQLKKSFEENKEKFYKECKTKHTPYALCLSKKRDNLTHWDRYAANCTGICMGINVSALDVLYQRTDNYFFGNGLFDIEPILYNYENVQLYIRNTIVQFMNPLLESIKKETAVESLSFLKKNGFMYLAGIYQKVMKFAKHNSFVDEDEIRLYYETEAIGDTLDLIQSLTTDLKSDIDFKSSFIDNLNINLDDNCAVTVGSKIEGLCVAKISNTPYFLPS